MSYSDLLPNELQEELIQLSEAQSRMEFRVGDIVTQVIAFNAQNQRVASVMDIYSAVGAFVGKSSRTVRDYFTVASFYPPHIREEYTVLKFDHFRQAMMLGPNWQKALEWAVEQVDQLGRPASVDAMIAQFTPEMEIPEDPEYDGDGEDAAATSQGFTLTDAFMLIHTAIGAHDLNPADKEQAETALQVLQEMLIPA